MQWIGINTTFFYGLQLLLFFIMAHYSIHAIDGGVQAQQNLAYQDFGEMLQHFHSVEELSNFAERNGLSADEQVIARLHELVNEDYYIDSELVNHPINSSGQSHTGTHNSQPGLADIKNFADAGELVEHADRYGLLSL